VRRERMKQRWGDGCKIYGKKNPLSTVDLRWCQIRVADIDQISNMEACQGVIDRLSEVDLPADHRSEEARKPGRREKKK
jgi:hypothetical protein